MTDNPDSIKSLAALAGAALGSEELAPDGIKVPVYVTPEGYTVEVPSMTLLEPWLLRPLRKRGTWAFKDVASFTRYFAEHKTTDSRIFAKLSDSGGLFSATLNFHGKEPSFNDHHAEYRLTPTAEWTAWTRTSGCQMTQPEFASWLEDHQEMFTSPSGADLLELISTLEGKANVTVKSAVKLQNHTIKLAYDEEVELKGGTGTQSGVIDMPAILTAGIAPFEGSTSYQVRARLKYKIAERKITFWYTTIDAHLVVRAVTADLLQQIEKQTGLEVFRLA